MHENCTIFFNVISQNQFCHSLFISQRFYDQCSFRLHRKQNLTRHLQIRSRVVSSNEYAQGVPQKAVYS